MLKNEVTKGRLAFHLSHKASLFSFSTPLIPHHILLSVTQRNLLSSSFNLDHSPRFFRIYLTVHTSRLRFRNHPHSAATTDNFFLNFRLGKVMRITKKARNGSSPKCDSNQSVLTEEERLLWRNVEELVTSPTKEIAEQIYTQLVMSPLLGSKHVDAGIRVPVTRDFLECVEKNVNKQRPAWRIDVSVVNLERDFVIIMSDHSLFPGVSGVLKDEPCISVEIKPKCGFIPSSEFIAERNSVKRSATRFQMHQVLKLREQEISELSEYDPLDLFSGSKERIHKAIKDLYTTPQNNFRVFLNGSLIFGGLGGGIKRTNAVAGKAFEDALEGIILAENGLRTTSFIQLVAEAVYCSRVLDGLLEVQRLDNFDIEGAIHAYYNIVCQPCAVMPTVG
ncbi:hypothetical protein NC653_005307 [Populus alba x Populus x berolinensis]|uniref:Inositol-pentakisphosphate 2-kinase n=1 Tax=Populus alba x Populus x berolinensis TaxID=444605 RepID=A0AAD6WAV8_9ROSI|nr:hypothetical protein NC653_005307 [Populus alba x Populus x berolinensis]